MPGHVHGAVARVDPQAVDVPDAGVGHVGRVGRVGHVRLSAPRHQQHHHGQKAATKTTHAAHSTMKLRR